MVQVQNASELLKKHNTEMYMMKRMLPDLKFINRVPIVPNDTGEFATIIDYPEEEILDPISAPEGTELTEISIEPLKGAYGSTSSFGFSLKYTEKFLNNARLVDVEYALSKIASNMCLYINKLIGNGMIEGAKGDTPTNLSSWKKTTVDPRGDAIKLRHKFKKPNLPFKLDTMLISDNYFSLLEEYYMSFDKPFNSESIDVDGTMFYNAEESFEGKDKDYLGFDSRFAPGTLETYVNPKYSSFKQANIKNPAGNIPDALFNINEVKDEKFPYNQGYDIWVDMGYSVREPKGSITGKFPTV